MEDGLRMGSAMGRASRQARTGSRKRLIWALFLLLIMAGPVLTACEPDAKSLATTNKAKLDTELHTASTSAGIPAIRLAPIIAQENSLAAATSSGSSSAYQAAADGYSKLYDQVVALEKMTPSEAQAQASGDLNTLQSSLAAAEGSGIADVTTAAKLFDASVPQAQQQLATAKTTKEYFAVDGYILEQSAAVTQILPDYQLIQTLTDLVNKQTATLAPAPGKAHVLQCATEGGEIPSYGTVPAQFWNPQSGYPIYAASPIMVTPKAPAQTYYFSAWPSQALASFKAALNANDFSVLAVTLQAQLATLKQDTDPSQLQRQQVAAAVARFQNDVNTYQTDAKANNDFLKTHRAKNKDVPSYNTVWHLTQNSNGYAPPSDFYPNVPDFQIDGKYATAVRTGRHRAHRRPDSG